MQKMILGASLAFAALFFFARISDAAADSREGLAKAFAGVYRFDYLFIESGTVYVDVSGHLQLLEADRLEEAPRVTFLNRTAKGDNRAHYSYVFYEKNNSLTMREFDGNGRFRFDCAGTYSQEKKTFQCSAPRAPKPARDTDSPITRKSGLFKRPISWPAYETLDRNNIFRFYDWGFVNVQENVKLDADGKVIARETGVITAVKVESSRERP